MRITFLTLSLLLSISALTQSFNEAMQLLNQNKRTEAKAAFNALKTGSQATDALMGLTILELDDSHFEEAFGHFQEFFSKHPDPYP